MGPSTDVSRVGPGLVLACSGGSKVTGKSPDSVEQVSIPAKEVMFLVVAGPLDLWYCL